MDTQYYAADRRASSGSNSLNGAIHFELSRTGKLFLTIVSIECVLLALLGIVSLFIYNDRVTIFYIILLLVAIGFLGYSAQHAVINENQYELAAFIATSFLLYIRVVINYVYESDEDEEELNDILYLIALIVASLFQVSYFYLAWAVYKDFGYRLYKTIGTDPQVIALYNQYQIFLSCIRLDIQLSIILICTAGLFLLGEDDWELYVDIVAMILTFIWAYFGHRSIRKERKDFMGLFFIFSAAEPIYIIYKFIGFFDDWDEDIPLETVGILAGLALLFRTGVIFTASRCVSNFGRGLKSALAREDLVQIGEQTSPRFSSGTSDYGTGN